GGAARAVCAALARAGAGEVDVLNRTPAKAEALAARFGARAGSLEAAAALVSAADLVVNATSVGLDGTGSPLPPGQRFKAGAWAYDLVYRPAETPFLRAAREGGAGALGGMGMLVAQAAATWRIWFGEIVPAVTADLVEKELEGKLL
ncbi:MAG: shikimate dehydrogenase, partial [Elusimicrobiota bacterium]